MVAFCNHRHPLLHVFLALVFLHVFLVLKRCFLPDGLADDSNAVASLFFESSSKVSPVELPVAGLLLWCKSCISILPSSTLKTSCGGQKSTFLPSSPTVKYCTTSTKLYQLVVISVPLILKDSSFSLLFFTLFMRFQIPCHF